MTPHDPKRTFGEQTEMSVTVPALSCWLLVGNSVGRVSTG